MAFLDNSGDIILDAVLTDTGRYRLAKGDGSFKIVKFALGDDEIDYSLYDKTNASGSVYYDLNILQTPILEALTDNASALKSHLLTINQTDLLFLPVIKPFVSEPSTRPFDGTFYAVVVDLTTEGKSPFNAETPDGVFFTANQSKTNNNKIALHQGLDTQQISYTQNLSPDLVESMYMIEMDSRLGYIKMNDTAVDPSYIDDDSLATYLVTKQRNANMVSQIGTGEVNSSIHGPRGTRLEFQLVASEDLQTSTFLFEQLGFVDNDLSPPNEFYVLDSTIRITGATTGYRVDIPIRFFKSKNSF